MYPLCRSLVLRDEHHYTTHIFFANNGSFSGATLCDPRFRPVGLVVKGKSLYRPTGPRLRLRVQLSGGDWRGAQISTGGKRPIAASNHLQRPPIGRRIMHFPKALFPSRVAAQYLPSRLTSWCTLQEPSFGVYEYEARSTWASLLGVPCRSPPWTWPAKMATKTKSYMYEVQVPSVTPGGSQIGGQACRRRLVRIRICPPDYSVRGGQIPNA